MPLPCARAAPPHGQCHPIEMTVSKEWIWTEHVPVMGRRPRYLWCTGGSVVHSGAMAFVRAVLNFVVAGVLVGVLAASWIGPRFLTWYNAPGASTTLAQCQCAELTRQVADEILGYQLKGGVTGGGAGLALGIGFMVWRRKAAKARAAGMPPTV